MSAQAIDFLNAGDTAVMVFTHGDNYYPDFQPDYGETGNWKITSESLDFVNKVIIYYRPKTEGVNHILLGDYCGFRKSEEPDRLIIKFSNLNEKATTELNWIEFSGGSQNPVRLISK